MAECIHVYSTRLLDDGRVLLAEAWGRPREDGTWEGWLEFADGAAWRVRTGRETTQPNRRDLEYWAGGLEAVYLEGGLERAKRASGDPPAAAAG